MNKNKRYCAKKPQWRVSVVCVFPSVWIRGIFMGFLLLLCTCAPLRFDPYGKVMDDARKIRPDGKAISMPAEAPSISQGFAPEGKNSGNEDVGLHEGIDIRAEIGLPVLAATSGIVIKSYFEPVYGHRVVIDRGQDEDGRFLKTRYFHLQERLAEAGQRVQRGQQIGRLGRTGVFAGGLAHLHFETRVQKKADQFHDYPVNPHRYWVNGTGIVTCFNVSETYPQMPLRLTYPVPCRGIPWTY